jgi:hypothetical protein
VATDNELIIRAVQKYFEGGHDADLVRTDRALRPDLVGRSPAEDGGWKIVDALWLPQ